MPATDWEGILKEHGPAVWRVCWRILSHRADVEECFQETFVAALRVSRGQPVVSWPALLHSLATARSVDRLRQRMTRRRVISHEQSPCDETAGPLERAPSSEAAPADHAVASELSDRLRDALTRLPEKQAQAFCLHALDGWPQQQVADHLGMSENAVAVTIHRARQRLKELLADKEPNPPRMERKHKERAPHVPPGLALPPPAGVAAAPIRAGGVS